MTSTQPGADELRMRGILRAHGVGADAPLPPVPRQLPPGFDPRERDWLDDILDDNATPAPTPAAVEEPPPATPTKAKKPKSKTGKGKKKRGRKHSSKPYDPLDVRDPRQSLAEAWDRIPPRLKWLAYHATAGYLGWSMGLVDWSTYVTRWIVQNGFIGPQAFFWYGAAALTFLLYRRTRRMWLPVAWLAAVPATSTVIGVLLYAPTS